MNTESQLRLSRRQILAASFGSVVAGAAALFELVDHGVLPGKRYLDYIDGACDVAPPPESFGAVGPTIEGSFYSKARGQEVAYRIAYPPGHGRSDRLPLIVNLPGLGGDQLTPIGGISPELALAGHGAGGHALPPMAIVSVGGGRLYWHQHPGDDPMAMLIDELIPLCQRLGLGVGHRRIGLLGISMGAYGTLLIAEKHPSLPGAVAAISPAVFQSYRDAINADPKSFTSPADFAANDVVTHSGALRGIPVRVASGTSDPFHPGVLELQAALAHDRNVAFHISAGCHSRPFFYSQLLPSLQFLGDHIAA
jgi:hypothetical protein